jgi:transposase-like protein
MIRQGGLCLSKKDLKVFQIIEQCRAGELTQEQAASKLDISIRTLQRKTIAIRKQGIEGLIHGNRGRFPLNKKSEDIRHWYVSLYKDRYFDFNMKHAFEFISERHNPPGKICYDTFRNWVKAEGLCKTKRRRPSKSRIMRERHANEGLMLQLDGSPHRYNGKDEWTLVHMIDDATSKLLAAELFKSETTFACLKVLRVIIEKFGIPEFILTDCAGWSARIGKRAHFSQFERACRELGITVIPTPSPQSKGRVERSFRTAQGRLPSELRLEGINKMETANRYLEQIFIPDWNRRFAVEAKASTTRFKPLPGHIDLDEVLCQKFTRMVNRDHTVNFEGETYKLVEPPRNLWKLEIEICKLSDGRLKMLYGAQELKIETVRKPQRVWKKEA